MFRPESPQSLCCELSFKHDGEMLSGIAATRGVLTCTPEGHSHVSDDEKDLRNELLPGKDPKRVASDKMRTGRCLK